MIESDEMETDGKPAATVTPNSWLNGIGGDDNKDSSSQSSSILLLGVNLLGVNHKEHSEMKVLLMVLMLLKFRVLLLTHLWSQPLLTILMTATTLNPFMASCFRLHRLR